MGYKFEFGYTHIRRGLFCKTRGIVKEATDRGLTDSEIADKAGVSVQTIQNWRKDNIGDSRAAFKLYTFLDKNESVKSTELSIQNDDLVSVKPNEELVEKKDIVAKLANLNEASEHFGNKQIIIPIELSRKIEQMLKE